MTKLLYMLLLTFFIIGCSQYKFIITMVEPAGKAADPAGMAYSDSLININFKITRKKIIIQLKNTGPEAIKIDWNQVYFKSIEGKLIPVYHGSDRPGGIIKHRKPTFIPSFGSLDDHIIPVTLFHNEGGIWLQDDLLKISFIERGYNIQKYIGMRFHVILAFYTGNSLAKYDFAFEIQDVIKTKEPGLSNDNSNK
ncbi:MAG: hypothetical protein ABIA63_10125 [bacterium]